MIILCKSFKISFYFNHSFNNIDFKASYFFRLKKILLTLLIYNFSCVFHFNQNRIIYFIFQFKIYFFLRFQILQTNYHYPEIFSCFFIALLKACLNLEIFLSLKIILCAISIVFLIPGNRLYSILNLIIYFCFKRKFIHPTHFILIFLKAQFLQLYYYDFI